MKKSLMMTIAFALSFIISRADNEWIHIYTSTADSITRVDSRAPEKIKRINYPLSESGTYEVMSILDEDNLVTYHPLQSITRVEVGQQVPTIYINIENDAEVIEKDKYLNAEIMIEGNGIVDDFPLTATTIKGRGNSTWNLFPKKPWRLKFSKKQQICGLAKAKNFALIANFIDPTHMRNTVAFRIGQILDMPWTNHSVPVNIVMNGSYRGLYMLTEKIGINSGSVDIDETTGILWELDTNYDENYKFLSDNCSLPVMVKDPDFDELAEENPDGLSAVEMFDSWRDDFTRMEASVFGTSTDDWTDYIDLQSLVRYVFVNSLVGNHEPTWPKSVYLHKAHMEDKYSFGPLWDFDWAYTFGGSYKEGAGDPVSKWLTLPDEPGGKFFGKLCRDARFRTEFKKVIDSFYENEMENLLDYIDEYAALIRPAAYRNGERWPANCDESHPYVASSEKFDTYLENMKTFLRKRLEFMRLDSNFGLY